MRGVMRLGLTEAHISDEVSVPHLFGTNEPLRVKRQAEGLRNS